MVLLATFEDLDPLLQLLAYAVGSGIIGVVGFQLWRYFIKRKTRRRVKIWLVY